MRCSRCLRVELALYAACLVAAPAFAQVDAVSTPPPNLVLNNYDSVPVGPYGGLEGSAYAARVGDPSAAWFNPAGRLSSDQVGESFAELFLRGLAPREGEKKPAARSPSKPRPGR